jgi:NAD(P)-dependent dehydrogenase (short-subunit alcohol dehydrogenase family)
LDRVALITGAGSGLGKAIAIGFAEYGAKIVSVDIMEGAASDTANEACLSPGQAIAITADVSDPHQVGSMMSKVRMAFDRIDILVNSAGVDVLTPSAGLSEDGWDRTIDVNLKGTFLCCQAVGKCMIAQRRGSIINLTSIGGIVALGRGTAAFGASKGGVNMITRELAIEWASYGVRVNAIAPCQFRTPALLKVLRAPQFNSEELMQKWISNIPLGRIGNAEEIVGPAVFLASDASSMVTGHILAVDGGYLAR